MIWLRKFIVHLLAVILLASLLAGAGAVSFNETLGKPKKVESSLNQSDLYNHVISTVINQAQQAINSQNSTVSFKDSQIRQAAETAFTPQLLQQYTNTFVGSNYAWLQGKTPSPNFSIDLTQAKQTFARAAGQQVATYLAGLPECNQTQLLQLEASGSQDPFSFICRPITVNAQLEGAAVAQQIDSSTTFLGNPTLTASSLSPNGNNTGEPYYKKLSSLPKVYQWAAKVPLILGAVAIISAVGIFFIAPRKRKGLRRIGFAFLDAGIILIVSRFVASTVSNKIETSLLKHGSADAFQQSLLTFVRLLVNNAARIELWFGISFMAIALVIFTTLITTRSRAGKSGGDKSRQGIPSTVDSPETTTISSPVDKSQSPQLQKPRRPRLIQ